MKEENVLKFTFRKDSDLEYPDLPECTLNRFRMVHKLFLQTYKVWKLVIDDDKSRRHIEWGFSNYLFALSSKKGVKDITSLGFISRDALLIKAGLHDLVNTPRSCGNNLKMRVTLEHVWPRRYVCEQLFRTHHKSKLKLNDFCNILLNKYLSFTYTSSSENDKLALLWQKKNFTNWQDAYKEAGIELHEHKPFKGYGKKNSDKLTKLLVEHSIVSSFQVSE